VRVVSSTISGNGGSGVFVYTNTGLVIINSTITGNAGGERNINPVHGKFGGGVYVGLDSAASIVNSSISGNSADNGAGLYVLGGPGSDATVTHSTITGNTATTNGGGIAAPTNLELKRTIVAGNTAPQGPEVFAGIDQNQYVTVGSFNIFGHNGNSGLEGFIPDITDIVPSQPLGAILNTRLASNGGPTQTHALVTGSPAIDAINDGTCPPPAKDQRGVTRPQDGNRDGGRACDVGAFEYVAPAL